MYTYVFQNVRAVDGLDGERQADVCVAGDRIARILPPNFGAEASRVIDGETLTLMPGIIDIHRHADLRPFGDSGWDEPAQGMTAMVSGNCGFSCVPNAPETFDAVRDYAAPILGTMPDSLRGLSTGDFFKAVNARPLAINCGYLVGNGSLRRAVAGFQAGALPPDKRRRVCELLDEALTEGALGLSMGIMYTPECYDTTAELSQVAAVAARHGKPVVAHIRGEGRSVVASVEEMIAIGRASGARIHISHMKAAGTEMWGWAVDEMLARIELARREGLDITFDAYPYTAGSTTLLSLLPPEALEGGAEGALRRIGDKAGRAAILKAFGEERDDWDNFALSLGWGRVTVADSSVADEIGRTVQALADEARRDPGEFALELLLREKGRVPVVLEEMDADDVRRIITQPGCIVISDSLYSGAGRPHPRKNGAFQRFLCQYVKEEKRLTLPQAVDRITRLPAEFFGLRDRGRLAEGNYADLALLDWGALRDRATYAEPGRKSEGVRLTMVNGEIVWQDGRASGKTPGKLLGRG